MSGPARATPFVTVPMAEARARFAEMVDLAKEEPVALTRHGEPVAFLVSPACMEAIEDHLDSEAARARREEWQKNPVTYSLEEVMHGNGVQGSKTRA